MQGKLKSDCTYPGEHSEKNWENPVYVTGWPLVQSEPSTNQAKNQKQQSKAYRRRRIQLPELSLDSNVQCLANNHQVYKEARKYGPFKWEKKNQYKLSLVKRPNDSPVRLKYLSEWF